MSLLRDAQAIVDGDRRRQYGHPVKNLRRVAAVWTALIGHDLTARDVALMLAALKLVREAHRPHRDNRLDAAGYIAIADLAAPAEDQ